MRFVANRYFCWNCRNFMSESDINRKWYHEHRGEYWGAPAYEDIYEDHCPFCGSESIDEAKCERCGNKVDEDTYHFEDDTLLCEACWEEDQEEET